MTLRALDPIGDRPWLEALWEAALGGSWPLLPAGLDIIRAGVVAEERGVAVGAVAVDPAGSIPLLLVDPAHQRRGVGTSLLAAALHRLGALGVQTVALGSGGEDYIWPGVPDDLPAAAPFFTARGWRWDQPVIDLVADQVQGRGVGSAMVALASELLRRSGTRACHIGWTVRQDFYVRVGYAPWRRYLMARRQLTLA